MYPFPRSLALSATPSSSNAHPATRPVLWMFALMLTPAASSRSTRVETVGPSAMLRSMRS